MSECMVEIAHERHEKSDAKRRSDEARLADVEVIRALEQIPKTKGDAK